MKRKSSIKGVILVITLICLIIGGISAPLAKFPKTSEVTVEYNGSFTFGDNNINGESYSPGENPLTYRQGSGSTQILDNKYGHESVLESDMVSGIIYKEEIILNESYHANCVPSPTTGVQTVEWWWAFDSLTTTSPTVWLYTDTDSNLADDTGVVYMWWQTAEFKCQVKNYDSGETTLYQTPSGTGIDRGATINADEFYHFKISLDYDLNEITWAINGKLGWVSETWSASDLSTQLGKITKIAYGAGYSYTSKHWMDSLSWTWDDNYGEGDLTREVVDDIDSPLYLEWDQVFGGGSDERGSSLWVNDTNVFTLGWTQSYGAGLYDSYVNKWDLDGNLVWTKTWGGSGYDSTFDIVGDNENIYICGSTTSYDIHGLSDALIMKWDGDGNVLWYKVWGTSYDDRFVNVCLNGSDIFVIGNNRTGSGADDMNLALVKYDTDGNKMWESSFTGSDRDGGSGVKIDGEFIYTCGQTSSFGEGNLDVLLIKWDANGNQIWNSTWGGLNDDWGFDLSIHGSEIYVAGRTASFGAGGNDGVVIKFDSDGNQIWNRTIGTTDSDTILSIYVYDSELYIGGEVGDTVNGDLDAYASKWSTDGDIIWEECWGGSSDEYGYDLVKLGSDLYFTGNTASYGGGDNCFLVKWNIEPGPLVYLQQPMDGSVRNSGTVVDVGVSHPDLDTVLYNWDDSTNTSWSDPYTTTIPSGDSSHTLYVYANTTDGNATETEYSFITDDTFPLIYLDNVINDSIQTSGSPIELSIVESNIDSVLYRWDDDPYATLTSPYIADVPTQTGLHILDVNVTDGASNFNHSSFSFTCLGDLTPTAIDNSTAYALCVGVEDYPGTDNDLDYCADDAIEMRTWFSNEFNVPWENTQVLTDSSATTSNINYEISNFATQMDDNDFFFFSFSGHGSGGMEPGETFNWNVESSHPYSNNYDHYWHYSHPGAELMRVHFTRIETEYGYDGVFVGDYHETQYAYDLFTGDYTDVWSNWVLTDDIYVELYTDISNTDWGFEVDQVQIGTWGEPFEIISYDGLSNGISGTELDAMLSEIPGTTITMLDSCFSGSVGTQIAGQDRYIVTGGTGNELTLEDSGNNNGLFTYQFLNAWNTATDSNMDTVLSFEEVFSNVYSGTVSRSSALGYVHHPAEFDGVTGELILNTNAEIMDFTNDSAGNLDISIALNGLGYGQFEVYYYDLANQSYFSPYSSCLHTTSSIQDFEFSPPTGFQTDVISIRLNAYYGAIHESDEETLYYRGIVFNATDDSDGDLLNDLFEFQNGMNPWDNDTDSDGLLDLWEIQYGLDPKDADTDNDGLSDGSEISTHGTDPLLTDTDGDTMADGWEIAYGLNATDPSDKNEDPDHDTLLNYVEHSYNTNPLSADSDSDSMGDLYEITWGLDPTTDDADDDLDSDSLINVEEFILGTEPNNNDTDSDGLSDGAEVNTYLTSPFNTDSDGDGLLDGEEVHEYGCDPARTDTDSDTLGDYEEVMTYGTNPNDRDTDHDGINDAWEIRLGTNPCSNASSPWMYLGFLLVGCVGFVAIPVAGKVAKKKASKKRDTGKLGPRPTPGKVEKVQYSYKAPISSYSSPAPRQGNPDMKIVIDKLLGGHCPACGGPINKNTLSCSMCYRDYSEFYRKMFGGK